eukprot:CAMPEP_0115248154 /NCGR_PEP_ID=MMETSP0270-20121206/41923_1 /TAXON_ID=71861 /ORGANISM="Scrippsiella trochoidea, Strain CCMP3099" /LENGTH=84 /DNA_ID=CAMNT_0002663445 /DNA_START=309 /DNA_END=563 /DNA_ORIENTATION=+
MDIAPSPETGALAFCSLACKPRNCKAFNAQAPTSPLWGSHWSSETIASARGSAAEAPRHKAATAAAKTPEAHKLGAISRELLGS